MIDDDPVPPDGDEDAAPADQPTVDAASVQTAHGVNLKQFREFEQAQTFWRGVFADQIGRREMWRVLERCHAFEERFAVGPSGVPQPEATWFHAGEQATGQRLFLHWSRYDRAGVFLMLDEHDPNSAIPTIARKRKKREA